MTTVVTPIMVMVILTPVVMVGDFGDEGGGEVGGEGRWTSVTMMTVGDFGGGCGDVGGNGREFW